MVVGVVVVVVGDNVVCIVRVGVVDVCMFLSLSHLYRCLGGCLCRSRLVAGVDVVHDDDVFVAVAVTAVTVVNGVVVGAAADGVGRLRYYRICHSCCCCCCYRTSVISTAILS